MSHNHGDSFLRRRGSSAVVLLGFALTSTLIGCYSSPEAKKARFMERGEAAFHRRDYKKAVLEFKNAAQARPNDAEPLYRLGLASWEAGDYQGAASALMRASQLSPKHAGAQLKLAELMAQNQNAEVVRSAEKRASALVEAAPNDPDALNVLGAAELRLNKPHDAAAHFNRALNAAPQHLKAAVNLANLKLAQGDIRGAEKVLTQAAGRTPDEADAALVLGRLYAFVNRLPEAEQQFRKALGPDPKNSSALLDLGAIEVRAGKLPEAERTYRKLANLPDKRYRSAHAEFLFDYGKKEDAIMEFRRLSQGDPEDRRLRKNLVSALVAVHDIAAAEAVLADELRRNPKDTAALLQRGELYRIAGHDDEAEKAALEIVHFQPDLAEVHLLLARIHEGRHATGQQQQELAEALRFSPHLLRARLDLAHLLTAGKGAKAALDLLNGAPDDQKTDSAWMAERNAALLTLGDRAALRKGIDEGLKVARTPELLVQEGLFKLNNHDFEGARAALNEALQKDPEEVRALEALWLSDVLQKHPDAALAKLIAHVEQHPGAAVLQNFLGQVLEQQGRRTEARAAFERARAADPTMVQAGLSVVDLDVADGRREDARKVLRELAASHPRNAAVHLSFGMLDDAGGRYPEAIEHYRKALVCDGRNIRALNNLAYTLAEHEGKLDEALRLAEQAVELAPQDATVQDTLGWIYFQKALYGNAVRYLETAAQGRGAAPKYHLAMAYLKRGDRERGAQALRAALKVDPTLPEADKAQELLAATN